MDTMKTAMSEMKVAAKNDGSDIPITWGVATLTLPGQTESGDQFLVKLFEDGALIGVIDGLGHGSEAAATAKAAVMTLEAHAREPVVSLINLCHQALRKTRGAVMSLALLNTREDTITWIAVGNVVAVLVHIDSRIIPTCEYILMSSGVVGDRLPALHSSVVLMTQGDMLILATDGIRDAFVGEISLWGSPQQIADRILAQYAKGNDEGLVLVVRFKGVQP